MNPGKLIVYSFYSKYYSVFSINIALCMMGPPLFRAKRSLLLAACYPFPTAPVSRNHSAFATEPLLALPKKLPFWPSSFLKKRAIFLMPAKAISNAIFLPRICTNSYEKCCVNFFFFWGCPALRAGRAVPGSQVCSAHRFFRYAQKARSGLRPPFPSLSQIWSRPKN